MINHDGHGHWCVRDCARTLHGKYNHIVVAVERVVRSMLVNTDEG